MFAISLIQQLGPRRLSRSELAVRLVAVIAALLLASFGQGLGSLAVVGTLMLLLVAVTLFEVIGFERSRTNNEAIDITASTGSTTPDL